LIAGTPITQIILLSPVVFGLAHIHHFYEFRIANPNVALPMAIARTVLQFSYTSLFGMYGTFLFLRTGSLLAVIAVHAFCNSMGLPRVWGRVEPWWMAPQEIDGPAGIRWTIVYYILLFGGMAAWYQGFWPLTQNAVALTEF
jgi:prenyl protein peptidase